MRQSLFLAILGLVGKFAYGFASTLPVAVTPYSGRTVAISTSITRISPHSNCGMDANAIRAGGSHEAQTSASNESSKCPMRKLSVLFSSAYGTGGVMYILIKAIRRVLPIALQPFAKGSIPLSQFQFGAYISVCLWFAYVEGYKGFQTKFAPLVVSRAFTLEPGYSKIHHFIFAPFYSMGLFHATKKRMTISWGVTMGVAFIVGAVKRLPYPWRNIIDAGVVAGLSWGCVSIFLQYLRAVVNGKVPTDPALPKED